MTLGEMLPYALPAALGYWANRLQRKADRAEERLEDVTERVIRAEEKIQGTEDAVQDIRENMARRQDLEALKEFLGQRIDDAVKYNNDR